MQDTRPLMAAMGAQAATQIEGNRMMTETMQKGMQGIENFAARRQLAATRAQLGALKLEDPDYGQKLAGLVLDNPLAFTNAKTAPLAEMAVKQASNTYLAKEKNKADALARYQEYRYGIDAINAKMRGDVSLASKQNARFAADVFRTEAAPIKEALGKLELARINATPDELAYIDQQTSALQNQLTESKSRYKDIISESTSEAPMDYVPTIAPPGVAVEDFTLAPTAAGNAGNGPEFPVAAVGEEGPGFLGLAPLSEDRGSFGPAPRAQTVPETEVIIPEMVPSGAPFGPETPAVPAVPAVPAAPASSTPPTAAAASPTAEQIEAGRLSLSRRLSPKTSSSGQASKMTQNQIDNLVNRNPDVVGAKLNEGMLGLEYMDAERALKKAEDSGDEEAIAKAEQFRASVSQALEFAKINAKSREASTAITASSFENPQEYLNYEQAFLAKREAEAQKAPSADQQAADNFLAATGAAGTTKVTPAVPPAPMNDMAKSFAEIEAPRRAAEANIIPETNQQWTDAKNLAIEALGGMEKVVQLTDEIYQNNVLGFSLPADRLRLTMAIQDKLLFGPDKKVKGGSFSLGGAESGVKILVGPDKKVKGFEQKSERSGVETVSVGEIAAALADDIIRAREAGITGSIPMGSTIPVNEKTQLKAQ